MSREKRPQGHEEWSTEHGESKLGVDNLRDLEHRLQIIETYVLHILPRNDEWSYARDFVTTCDFLDHETQEAYVHTLREMEEERFGTKPLKELDPLHDEEDIMHDQLPDNFSVDSVSTVIEAPLLKHTRTDSERDYGIEDSVIEQPKIISNRPPVQSAKTLIPTTSNKSSRTAARVARDKPTPSNLLKRGSLVLSIIRQISSNVSTWFLQNPFALLRFVFFLMGLLVALSRRDVKDRLKIGWNKVKTTIGMGVKVTYV